MIRTLLAWTVWPMMRLAVRVLPESDPWERLHAVPALAMYGAGARHDFAEYLTGRSRVEVASIDEIQDWLLRCRYVSDELLFSEVDHWQHPTAFERRGAGDCEDFALWGWRKLVELRIAADFVTGYCIVDGALESRHAWIVFRHDGVEYLFDPVVRDRETMVRPLHEVRGAYIPQFGADSQGRRFAYGGCLVVERLHRRRR